MGTVSDQPLSRSLAAELREKILSEEPGWAPGDKLPTEPELVAAHGVSRSTVRAALGFLTAEGLVSTGKPRHGRVVRKSRVLTFQAMTGEKVSGRVTAAGDGWVTDCSSQGMAGTMKIHVEMVEATEALAAALRVKEGDTVVARRRVRYLNGQPHNQSDSYYTMSLAQAVPQVFNPADVPQGVIALMAKAGYVQTVYDDALTARMPTPGEAAALVIPQGVPVIVQTRTGYTEGREQVVRVTVTIWPGDRSRIEYPEIPA